MEPLEPTVDLRGNWQGYFVGTNRGIVWLQLQQQGSLLTGSGNFSDFDLGQTTFELRGELLHNRISATLMNLRGGSGTLPNSIQLSCEILDYGPGISGTWESDIGTRGAIVFSRVPESVKDIPPALYSKPVELRSYKLDGQSFAGLLDIVLRGMFSKPIFRITESGTSHIKRGVDELIRSWQSWPKETINDINIFVSDTVASQSAREILIELKKNDPNRLTVTSPDVVWVDGKIVQIQSFLKRHEVRLNYYYRRYGLFLNSIIFLSMLVWFPSIQDIRSRLYVVIFVVASLTILSFVYKRLLPNTQIFVREKKPSFIRRNRDHILVYTITAIIGLAISRMDKIALYLEELVRFVFGIGLK